MSKMNGTKVERFVNLLL